MGLANRVGVGGAIDRLLAQPVEEEHEVEDIGIGAYECHGQKGYDRRVVVNGMAWVALPEGMSRAEARKLVTLCPEEVTARVHSRSWGECVEWEGELRIEEIRPDSGYVIWDGYTARPVEEERDV